MIFFYSLQLQLYKNDKKSCAEEIDEPISNMDPNTNKLIIFLNSGNKDRNSLGEHWHLLVYVVDQSEWHHYNSVRANRFGKECGEDARKMMQYCTPHINKWCRKNKKPCKARPKFVTMDVPEQGSYPDCLLYICYWFKRIVKADEKDKLIKDPQQMKAKMQEWRLDMAHKLLTASHPEESWNELTTMEYLSKFNFYGGC